MDPWGSRMWLRVTGSAQLPMFSRTARLYSVSDIRMGIELEFRTKVPLLKEN